MLVVLELVSFVAVVLELVVAAVLVDVAVAVVVDVVCFFFGGSCVFGGFKTEGGARERNCCKFRPSFVALDLTFKRYVLILLNSYSLTTLIFFSHLIV